MDFLRTLVPDDAWSALAMPVAYESPNVANNLSGNALSFGEPLHPRIIW